MNKRAYNFNAGPAALPLEVLQQAQEQFVDFQGIGMSIMEVSHRSKQYEQVHNETQALLKELLHIPDNYKIMFLQGGASSQFTMIPMNLVGEGQVSSYVHTGSWANKAIKEAKLFSDVHIAASSKEQDFKEIPDLSALELPEQAAYLHITSNETIGGIQYQQFPQTGKVPLIADMSSDILCRPLDVSKFGLIYAGAQKNLGPSGVTIVIAREDLVQESPANLPSMFRYDTHIDNNSLYNTPPVYSIYMVNLVLKWVKEKGGLAEMEQFNQEKTKLIYDVIDQSQGFYRGVAAPADRSIMNLTFTMENEALEKQFIQESQEAGFVGLKGHRSVGGLRASTYNAVPYESCKALQQFMLDFQKKHG
ncbi:3-phosphoserine/phosphohydroxythreonine transaminase [Marinicrinis sediminis]|uniref:Phosphoserine aminotransferase n=1 Tax=Marinicrinis sediminis TaxID=1652465 RepID=A0ABW5R9B6_9BACL